MKKTNHRPKTLRGHTPLYISQLHCLKTIQKKEKEKEQEKKKKDYLEGKQKRETLHIGKQR